MIQSDFCDTASKECMKKLNAADLTCQCPLWRKELCLSQWMGEVTHYCTQWASILYWMLKRQRPIIHRSGLLQLPPIASNWTNHHLFFGCIVSNLRIPILLWSLCCFASSFLETGQLLRNHVTHCQTNNANKYKTDMVMYDASNLLWAVICLDNVWIPQRSKSKKCNKCKRTSQTQKRDNSMQLLSEMSQDVLPIFSLLLFSPDLMELSTLLW